MTFDTDEQWARWNGYATVDEYVAELEAMEWELKLANAKDDDERERLEHERSRKAHDRLFRSIERRKA